MPGWPARGQARVPRLTETPTRTLKLTISYDGTRFVGWQRQAEGVSIQGLLEDALARFDQAPVAVQGAGRTDAGVHALGQVASVQMTSMHSLDSVARGPNASLPPDVRVIDIQEVAADFLARFSARSKTYRYQVQRSVIASPFERAYVWHVPETLDVDAMRVAAQMLVGTHDFAAFQSTGSDTKTTVRTITKSAIGERAAEGWRESTAPLLVYEVSGEPVRDRDARLQKLFVDAPPGAVEQARRILAESARYNLGTLQRDINVPTMALTYLRESNQSRSDFSIDGNQDIGGVRAVVLEFKERASPTIVRSAEGDLPATGRVWIEPDSGRVLKTEISMASRRSGAKITVTYGAVPEVTMWVPIVMTEEYTGAEIIFGKATYSKFRQFAVSTAWR